jgi:asparagine N-glycosylation enzyme membrane subunit Stt3
LGNYEPSGSGSHETGEEPHHHHPEQGESNRHHDVFTKLNQNKFFFILILVILVAVAILVRSGMLAYSGLFEPDGFFHYSVVEQSIANGYVVPLNSSLSGFPTHNYISEPAGLYYMTLIPYFFLHFLGITAIEIMRYIGIVFGLLDCIGAYFLAKRLSNSKGLGLLAFAFVAVSNGDIARTAALVYRGDTFVTFFLLVSLLALLKSFDSKKTKKYLYMALSVFLLSITNFVWNGAPFAIIIYIGAVALFAIYAFIDGDRDAVMSALVVSAGLIIWYALVNIYNAVNLIRGSQALMSPHFFLFYIPLVLGILLSHYLLGLKEGKISQLLQKRNRRLLLVCAFVLVVFIAIYATAGAYIAQLAGGGGGVISNNIVGNTTQELQKPSLAFIWASFGWQIFLAPLGLLAFIIAHLVKKRRGSALHSNSQIYCFILMFVYFMATAWLQANALRYNSLLAVPVAIFSAYLIYILGKVVYDFSVARGRHAYLFYIYMVLAVVILALCTKLAYVESTTSAQADGINPYFLQAAAWFNNNAPSNATVLALWPDGSVVEGWGNRQSYLDSVGGELYNHIVSNSQFILNDTPDTGYLYSIDKPDYLLVRSYWFDELGGIAIEANITNTSLNNYGYTPLQGKSITQAGNNSVVYSFYAELSNGHGEVNNIVINTTLTQNGNGTQSAEAYIGDEPPGAPTEYLQSVIFYNAANGYYNKFDYNSTVNRLNYTLVISVLNRNITSVMLAGPDLAASNMFKFLMLCNSVTCPYGNGNVSLQLVYQNQDSKIFKIVYG